MEIVFATNNMHKHKEVSKILSSDFKLLTLKDIGCKEDIPEEKPTLEGNALDKAKYIYEKFNCNVFADDTGLEVDALEGMPGVFSARYAGEHKNSDDNINKLLAELEGVEKRNARFRTVIALIIDGKEFLFQGIVNGKIINERKGQEGFGYDPIFVPDGYTETFAELPLETKNKISHRAKATFYLISFLNSNFG